MEDSGQTIAWSELNAKKVRELVDPWIRSKDASKLYLVGNRDWTGMDLEREAPGSIKVSVLMLSWCRDEVLSLANELWRGYSVSSTINPCLPKIRFQVLEISLARKDYGLIARFAEASISTDKNDCILAFCDND